MINVLDQFRQGMTAAGLEAPDVIHDDGAIHRFSPSGRGSDKPAWYMLHMDGTPAGAFGDWRSGLQSAWCAKSDNAMTPAELADHRQRIKAMRVQREADTLATQQQASEIALQRLNDATLCTQHAYTGMKGAQCHGVRIDAAGALLVPMRDTAGELHSLQSITPDGEKRFHPGGRIKGCYHSIGKPAGRFIVCEGYATGASIHEATGDAVAVAFNAGNVGPVALALRTQYPDLKIIVAADDDHLTDGNPGMSKATAAAQAVGGLVAVPSFPAGRPDKATDFNDLHQLAGADTVKACIDFAIESVATRAGTQGNRI